MARSRNIKPAFFKNEVLAVLPPNDKLTFIGLWMLADREGRLEDRPLRIKAELFPYFDMDVEGCLFRLHQAGFILRYQVSENKYICIPTWRKHQSPHIKECASTIPAPCEHQSSPPDSLFSDSLFSDSLNLTSDSPLPEPRATLAPAVVPHPISNEKDFQSFMGIFMSLGVAVSETDMRRCCHLWISLDQPERMNAYAYAQQQRGVWATRSENFVPRPWNYLTDKSWTRRAVVKGREVAATKSEMASDKAKQLFRKEMGA
jgi:hypothetical protein